MELSTYSKLIIFIFLLSLTASPNLKAQDTKDFKFLELLAKKKRKKKRSLKLPTANRQKKTAVKIKKQPVPKVRKTVVRGKIVFEFIGNISKDQQEYLNEYLEYNFKKWGFKPIDVVSFWRGTSSENCDHDCIRKKLKNMRINNFIEIEINKELNQEGLQFKVKNIPAKKGKIKTFSYHWLGSSDELSLLSNFAVRKVLGLSKHRTKKSSLLISGTKGANVYMDGKKMGLVPRTLKGLQPGPYKLKLSLEGYVPQQKNILVKRSDPTTLHFKLKEERFFYQEWWFWAGTGAAILAISLPFMLSGDDPVTQTKNEPEKFGFAASVPFPSELEDL